LTSKGDSQRRFPPDSGTEDAFMGLSQPVRPDMAAEQGVASP
jgi:hypothetical protein